MKLKINWQKSANPIIVSLLALVFFISTACFNYYTQDKDYVKWASPDETANYFFSKEFAENGQLSYFDSAAVIGDNMVMPRSLRSDAGWIKPVSFLGISLTYGSIASVLGTEVIPYLTPFFAALGIIVFYLLISRVFDSQRIGLISAFLLASFPVYIYYTVRSMFHNTLFIVFLIFGIYFFTLALGEKRTDKIREEIRAKFFKFKFDRERIFKIFSALFSGIFIGLTVITRTSEILWLLPALGIIWVFYARRFGFIKLMIFFVGLMVALMPVIYWNNILYQNSFRGGYNEMNRSLDEISNAGAEVIDYSWEGKVEHYKAYYQTIKKNIFYFGFKKEQSIEMFYRYVVDMFQVLVYLGLFGFLLLIAHNIKHFKKKYLVYVLVWGVLGVILVFYYGSWKFNDNPNPDSYTIGNSYTRYWLPIYIMLLPLVAYAIVNVTRALCSVSKKTSESTKNIISAGLQAAAVLGISYLGIMFVLFGSEEGLVYLYHTSLAEKNNAELVFSLTEPESIIITQYYDKFFFPERRIIMGRLPNDEILTATQKLIKYYPVYYYNFFLNDKDVAYLNERKLSAYNLEIKLVKKVNAKFGLYKLNERPVTFLPEAN